MLPRLTFCRGQNLARRPVRYRGLPQIQKLWQGEDRGWMWINHPGNLPKGEQYCPKAHRGSHQHGGLRLMQGSAQLFEFMDMCWSWLVESRSTQPGFCWILARLGTSSPHSSWQLRGCECSQIRNGRRSHWLMGQS